MNKISFVRKGVLLAGLILSTPLYAQHIPMLHDANGREVGSLEDFIGGNQATIATVNGEWIRIDVLTGEVVLGFGSTYYENRGCTGRVSINGETRSLVNQIKKAAKDGRNEPAELFLLSTEAEYIFITYQSLIHNETGGCLQFEGEGLHTVLERIDPEDYGFILQPNGEWMFPTPLKVVNEKIIKSEVIFCNGLENCPIQ